MDSYGMTKYCFDVDVSFTLNLQPDLSENPFLLVLNIYLILNRLQKRLGAEGGNSCPNH